MAYEKRDKFDTRINNSDKNTKDYYNQLSEKLLSYKKVKVRLSARCATFKKGQKIIAKIALGGKTLKLYLALDANDPVFEEGKYHQRDLSETKAYESVPSLLLIKSELAVRKAFQVIDSMMQK